MKDRDLPSIRVQRACACLKAGGTPVSLASICRTANRLDGYPLAASTVLHDFLAAEVYRANRTWRPPPRRRQAALFSDLPGDRRQHALNLLKRRKSALVRLMIELEAERAHDKAELQYLRSLEPVQRDLPSVPADAHAQLGYIHALLAAGRMFDARFRPGKGKWSAGAGGANDP